MSKNLNAVSILKGLRELTTEIELTINRNPEVAKQVRQIDNQITSLELEEKRLFDKLDNSKLASIDGIVTGRNMKTLIIITPINGLFPDKTIKSAKKSEIRLSKNDQMSLVIGTKKTYADGILKTLRGKFYSWAKKIGGN